MSRPDIAELPDLLRIALAWSKPPDRLAWHAVFALDTHMAALLRGASEPMLGQIRLAWWRDRLTEAPATWPKGNPVLSLLAQAWGEPAAELAPLVDGWEHLLVEKLTPEDIEAFAAGRAAAMAALRRKLGQPDAQEAVGRSGRRWALADLASHSADPGERDAALQLAQGAGQSAILPRAMRPLAILDGLARRSLAAGGAPLFGGRRAALTALRLGMFGR